MNPIRVGIGGWTFEPWRGTFYPPGLPHARELEHASRQVTAIEINGTYYRLQSPTSFAGWARTVPEDFVFTVKASRHCTNRRDLGEAGEAIDRFLAQGLTELGPRLGPILWQFMPTKRFDPEEFGRFLALLPASLAGTPLRHALEVRHPSFACPDFTRLARDANAAIVLADSDDYPAIDEPTADFTYARLQRARETEPAGYEPAEITRWANIAREHARRGPMFVFMINGAKVRAPAAARALIEQLKENSSFSEEKEAKRL